MIDSIFKTEPKPGDNGLHLLIQGIRDLKKSTDRINIPESVEVANIDHVKLYLRTELARLAQQINKIVNSISFPKSIQVSNFPKYPDIIKIQELQQVIEAINDLRALIAQTEYNPTINIETPKIEPPEVKIPPIKVPPITVPKAEVRVEPQVEIDLSELSDALKPLKYLSDKAGKPLSVRLSDGVKFIKALQDFVGKQEKWVTAFSTSKGLDEDEFENKFEKMTQASKAVGFKKTVAAAGTPVVLGTASCYRVQLSGDTDAGIVTVVGGSNAVRAASGSKNGIVIIPGNPPVTIDVDSLSKLWVDAETNGGVLCGVYYQR